MNDKAAKRFVGAALRFRSEVKEAAKELDDEDYRMKMEELGENVVTSTESIIVFLETLSRLRGKVEEESEVSE